MTQTRSLKLVTLLAMASVLALAWWGWQNADASLLLLGARLC